MNIVWVGASWSNFTQNRSAQGGRIRKITIHHAATSSLSAVDSTFNNPGRQASSHYAVKDNTIHQYVAEWDVAWTDGNWNSNINSVTIEVVNSSTGGDWPVSDATFEKTAQLCADIIKRNGLGSATCGGTITWHQMYAATACPGPYLLARMQSLCNRINEIIGGSPAKPDTGGGSSGGSTGGGGKDLDTVAWEVIAGNWGNGADRVARLNAAGYNADKVQERVNALLGFSGGSKPSPPQQPSGGLDDIAWQVIAGSWGNGSDRVNRLTAAGYDYTAVQVRVNQLLGYGGGGSSSAAAQPKGSLDNVAWRVIRGDYGNGQARFDALAAEGWDAQAVQNRVNQLLG